MNVTNILKLCEIIDSITEGGHAELLQAFNVEKLREMISQPLTDLEEGDDRAQLFEALQHVAKFANRCADFQQNRF